MGENMSLSDIAAVTRGTDNDGWGSGWFLIVVLFLFMFGFGNNGWNRQGEFGQYATAASQQEIPKKKARKIGSANADGSAPRKGRTAISKDTVPVRGMAKQGPIAM